MPKYTSKQNRVLDVVKAEIDARHRCNLSYSQLAERAGVGKWTVRAALDKARVSGELLAVCRQDDGLSNVISLPPAERDTAPFS